MAYLPPFNGGRINATITGNTAGTGSLISSGTMVFAGGNNITLSQHSNTITISGPSAGATGSNTFGMSNLGNTSGTTGMVTGTAVQFAFAGGNNVTLSQSITNSSGTITISGPNMFNAGVSTGGNTEGITGTASNQIVFAGINNVTLSQNTGVGGNTISVIGPTASNFNAGMIAAGGGNTSGTTGFASKEIAFAGGNNITVSLSVGGLGIGTLTVSGPNMFNEGISNIGNTAGTSGTASNQIVWAGGNNITLSQSTGVGGNTISISGLNALTTARASNDAIGLNAAGTNVTWTANSSGLSLNAAGYAGTGFSGTNATATLNSNGLQLSVGAGGGGGAALSAGTQSVSTGTVGFVNSNGISFGMSGSSHITASYTVPTQSVQTQNMVALYDGAETISSGTASFDDGGGVSFGFNGQTITAAAPSGGGGIVLYDGANSITSGTVSLQDGNGVSLGINGQTLTASIAGGNPNVSFYQNLAPGNSVQPHSPLAVAYNTLLMQPLSPMEGYGFPGDMTVSTLMIQMSGTATATSISSSYSSKVLFGLYSLANSSELSLVNSVSTGWSVAANTGNTTGWMGARFLTFHSSLWSSTPVLSNNGRYWYGVIHESTNLGTAAGAEWMGQYLAASTQRSGTWGVSQNTATSMGHIPFLGIYNTSLTSMPATIANSQINKANVSAGFMPGLIMNATFTGW